jgi:hypothetical protein
MSALIITIFLILLLALLTSVLISWIAISHDPFSNIELKSGTPYVINDRNYVFPKIKVEGKCLLLKPTVIENLRTIVSRVHALFQHLGIDYHVTGGTLLGVVRHESIPMPQDDDVDLAVDFCHRDFLFSPEFKAEAENFGLEPRFLAGTTKLRSDRHGAALRLQLLGLECFETCDVFFLEREGSLIYKVDGWLNGKLIKNAKEQFHSDDVYPRKLITVDEMQVYVPNNPKALLIKQYGLEVLEVAKIRPRLISHSFPMRFLRLLWVKHV